jgi:hypothetical protein
LFEVKIRLWTYHGFKCKCEKSRCVSNLHTICTVIDTYMHNTGLYSPLSGEDENKNHFWYRMLVFNIFEIFETLPF